MRENAVKWLTANYKDNYAPKKKKASVAFAKSPPSKKRNAADAFFLDDDEDEETFLAELDNGPVVEIDLSEVEDYLQHSQLTQGMDFDLLEWWKRRSALWPNLSKMARQYLSLPATSGAVERLFTAGGVMNGDLRKSTKEKTLEVLLYVHKNA